VSKLSSSQLETIAIFTSGADKLEESVASLSEKQLDYSMAPGEWTVRQIIHHVAEDGDAWSFNFKKALAAAGMLIQRGQQSPENDAWAKALSYDKRPVQASLALLRAHRQIMAELAEFFPDRWENSIIFVDSGGNQRSVSAGGIIRMVGNHLLEHVNAINAIKRQHGIV